MPNPECEDSTVASPMMQKEKPMRLYADIARDAEWFEQQSSFCGGDDDDTVNNDDTVVDPRMAKLAQIDTALCEISKNAAWLTNRVDAFDQRRAECM